VRSRLIVTLALGVAAVAAVGVSAATSGEIRILRDNYGVPHVYADQLEPLFFGFGYVVAEDRLFQLEMMRRSVWGTVSEVLGPQYVDFDRRARQIGYTRAEIRSRIDKLAPDYQTMLKAYADGINWFIETAEQGTPVRLPPEFGRLGIRPAPWTAEDVGQVFVGTMGTRFSDFTHEMENAALLAGLRERFGPAKGASLFDDIVPTLEDPESVTTIPASQVWRRQTAPRPAGPGSLPGGIRQATARLGEVEAGYLANLGRLNLTPKLGSNCWVVSATRTGNGSAILHGGPQMGYFTPGYLHEVGLHGAGFDVVGSTPTGTLPILFGHNATAAWSSTAGAGDVVDVFAETIDPAHPTRYRFNGQWREMEGRDELIRVKGAADVQETFFRTVHGPVVAIDAEHGVAYSRGRAWAGLELESMAGWIDKTKAETYEAFIAASHKMAISINWYYADRGGNIGWAYTGRYPVRHPDQDPRLPTPGTGEREWRGFVPAGEVPHVLNPDQGFIANWNQQPAVGWYFPGSGLGWGRTQRAKLLIDYLEARRNITVDDVKNLNRYASFAENNARFFRPLLLEAVGTTAADDAELKRAAEALAAWNGLREDNDGDGSYDSPGVAIFDAWLKQMFADTFTEQTVGPAAAQLRNSISAPPVRGAGGGQLLLNILQGERSPVRVRNDYLGGATSAQAMVASLRKAVASLKDSLGPAREQWHAPAVQMVFRTANFLNVPQAFHDQPALLSMNRGTENHLVVLSAAGVWGMNVVPPGQSGSALSGQALAPHAADQLLLFERFEYKPMYFDAVDVARAAERTEVLSFHP